MKKIITYILVSILSVGVGVCGTIVTLHYFPLLNEQVITEKKDVTITEENTIKEAVDKIYDAVVLVQTISNGRETSTGTGFVYKTDDKYGYIMTNHHVIEGGSEIKITYINGEVVTAKVLGSDQYSDIAVLSVAKGTVLQVAQIGESSKSEVGDTLFTVGSPMGADYMGTVTKGIMSGKDRTIEVTVGNSEYIMEVLQTDAAINPGNSGGPLVNINGEVIGVNSLKLVKDTIEGMGFAIPIEIAMTAAETLEKGENLQRPLLGVQLVDISNSYAIQYYGLKINSDIKSGLAIALVEADSAASAAKLEKNDVIIELGGTKVTSMAEFRFALYKYKVGDTIKIKVNRGGDIKEIEVNLSKGME